MEENEEMREMVIVTYGGRVVGVGGLHSFDLPPAFWPNLRVRVIRYEDDRDHRRRLPYTSVNDLEPEKVVTLDHDDYNELRAGQLSLNDALEVIDDCRLGEELRRARIEQKIES